LKGILAGVLDMACLSQVKDGFVVRHDVILSCRNQTSGQTLCYQKKKKKKKKRQVYYKRISKDK